MPDKHLTLFLTNRGERHQRAVLEAAPPELEVIIRRLSRRDEVLALLPEVEFLISERAGDVDVEIIRAGMRLRLIQRLGRLTHDIDLVAARAAGVPVCAVPVRESGLVAEHMLMQMLVLVKRLREVQGIAVVAGEWGESRLTDEDTFAYNWSRRRGINGLWGKTVGIWGFGEIGAELAQLLHGFGLARILYYKRTRLPEVVEADIGLTFADPVRLCAESDFVCVLLPYSPETELSVTADLVSRMKPTAFVVSCGSGRVISEKALADAIYAGRLAGAALDTFEWEPIRHDNPLLPLARDLRFNVLLTPHTAAGSVLDYRQMRTGDYDNLLRLLRGEPLLHQIV